MAAHTIEPTADQADPATCRTLSTIMRKNLALYELKPSEYKFAQLLVLETFDQDRYAAPIQMDEWARALKFRDARGLRSDKARAVFDTLRELQIVDANEGQGTYQLRPDIGNWSKLRPGCEADPAQKEIKLCAERPLDEALSSVSRENALASGEAQVDPDLAALFAKLKEMLAGGCSPLEVDNLYEDLRRKNPTRFTAAKFADLNSPQNPALPAPSEKSDAIAIASSALFNKAKLAKGPEKSAEMAEKAFAWLERIDVHGHLKKTFGPQWRGVCDRDWQYVWNRLRPSLEDYNARVAQGEPGLRPIADPLAWLARKARDEGRLQRP